MTSKGSKGHRKNPKRVSAGKKAYQTRKKNERRRRSLSNKRSSRRVFPEHSKELALRSYLRKFDRYLIELEKYERKYGRVNNAIRRPFQIAPINQEESITFTEIQRQPTSSASKDEENTRRQIYKANMDTYSESSSVEKKDLRRPVSARKDVEIIKRETSRAMKELEDVKRQTSRVTKDVEETKRHTSNASMELSFEESSILPGKKEQVEIDMPILDVVWSTKIKAPNDPSLPVYLGVERLVTDKQVNDWKLYAKRTSNLTHRTIGPLNVLARKSNKPNTEVLQEREFFDQFGMSTEEFLALKETMKELKLYDYERREILRSIPAGVDFMNIKKGNFIVYASKKPITGLAFTDEDDGAEFISVADYKKKYDKILMTMSAWIVNGTSIFSHLGISSNPFVILDPSKRYRGLSIKLHQFSALVFLTIFNQQFLVFSPTEEMLNIIEKHFKVIPREMFEIYLKPSDIIPLPKVPGINPQKMIKAKDLALR